MKSGISISSGEIWLVPFPYSDYSNTKKRPVLVITNKFHNKFSQSILVCQITSQIKLRNSLPINTESLEFGSLHRPSEVRFDNILNLDKKHFDEKIGKLDSQNMKFAKHGINSFVKRCIF